MEEIEAMKPWEEDWDDDIQEDNFATLLRQELA